MSNSSPKVSIILPVFNGGATLLSAVQSIVDQDYFDWELIIVDDGSTDECTKYLERLDVFRIKVYVDGFRKGLATRLNEGIDCSKGLYIARMDADDLCFPSRLKKQVDYLDTHPQIDLLATKALGFSNRGNQLLIGVLPYYEKHEDLSASPWSGIYMPHPSWMGRSAWFRKYRYRMPEVLRAEDQELLLRAMPESRYYCLPEVLLAYRQSSFNLQKSFLARRELFKCQIGIFLERHQWRNLLKTFWITLKKMSFDLLRSALPFLTFLSLKRGGEISAAELDQFHLLIEKYEDPKAFLSANNNYSTNS
jgi:glycosyltransferase involved in cell wall biosynthesis